MTNAAKNMEMGLSDHGQRYLALNIPDAAKAAGVSRSRLYIALRAGELPSLKIGKRRLVEVSSLRRWLENHRVSGTAGVAQCL